MPGNVRLFRAATPGTVAALLAFGRAALRAARFAGGAAGTGRVSRIQFSRGELAVIVLVEFLEALRDVRILLRFVARHAAIAVGVQFFHRRHAAAVSGSAAAFPGGG